MSVLFHFARADSAETPLRDRSISRTRWAAVGAAVAVAVGGGGLLQAMASSSDIAAPAVFVATTPCRLLDTRPAPLNVGSRVTPLGPNSTYTTTVIGTNGNCVLPDDAASLVMNVTVTNPSASSYLTVYSPTVARPTTSSLNWTAASADVANAVTASVSPSGEISFYNNRGTTDLVADVVGYYTAGPLKNMYTKAEVDALIAAVPAAVGPVGPVGATGLTGAKGEPGVTGVKGDTGDSVLGGLRCATNQVIAYDGAAWACAGNQDTLAGLHCTTNQSIGWDGMAWICRSAPIVATLTRTANGQIPIGSLYQVFQAMSPDVDPTGSCDPFQCRLRLVDVVDHTTCQVSFTGNDGANQLVATTTQTDIYIEPMFMLNLTQPLYVNISCAT
jgi:hypothetical protein